MENNEGNIPNKDENNNVNNNINNNQNENSNTSNKQQDKKSKIFLWTLIPIIVLIFISTAIIIPIKIQEIRYNKTVKTLMLGNYLPILPNNQIEIKENNKTRLIMNLKKVNSKAYNQIIENAQKKYPLYNSNKTDEFIGYNQNGFQIKIHRTSDTVDIEIKRTIVQKQSSIDTIKNAEKNLKEKEKTGINPRFKKLVENYLTFFYNEYLVAAKNYKQNPTNDNFKEQYEKAKEQDKTYAILFNTYAEYSNISEAENELYENMRKTVKQHQSEMPE